MLLSAKGLRFRYRSGARVSAVEQLLLEGGETVLLLGGNGAGKTTLIRLLTGDLKPTEGAIQICGTDPRKESARRSMARWHVIPQSPDFHLLTGSCGAELQLAAKLSARGPLSFNSELKEVLAFWPTATVPLDVNPHDLEHADRWRLVASIALASNPRLLIIDEIPITDLTSTDLSSLIALIAARANRRQSTIISVHNLRTLLDIADVIWSLEESEIRVYKDPTEANRILSSRVGTRIGNRWQHLADEYLQGRTAFSRAEFLRGAGSFE